MQHTPLYGIKNRIVTTPERIRTSNLRFRRPIAKTSKHQSSKALTKTSPNDLASYLASIIEKYPELVSVVEWWPGLGEHIKSAIIQIIGGE
jgi:hypothetical protein